MTTLFCPDVSAGRVSLPSEETSHVVQVLRHRVGDPVLVTNGQGQMWEGVLTQADRRGASVQLGALQLVADPAPVHIHILLAPPKNRTRLEWFLEKVTEIGIHQITLIRTERTERSRWRYDRLRKVLIAAMKQSGQAWLPRLTPEEVPFSPWAAESCSESTDRFILTCDWGNLPPLASVYQTGRDVQLLIGPEGDFTSQEVNQAVAGGARPVLLGPHRLRTETAGIVACSQIHTCHAH